MLVLGDPKTFGDNIEVKVGQWTVLSKSRIVLVIKIEGEEEWLSQQSEDRKGKIKFDIWRRDLM